jgi:hypothetical protein
MTSTSTKDDPTGDDARLRDLERENAALKREVEQWARRAERAEKESLRWRTTADEWRHEWMKRGR